MTNTDSGVQGTAILACTCKHDYQDKKYGRGKRVHNRKASKSTHNFKCTVCGYER